MGTNLAATLDSVPQTGTVVSAATSATDPREVLRCPQCQLVQYRTQSGLCRRCRNSVDAVPEPAPPPALVSKLPAELEPGIETAEATGVPVPDVAAAIRLWRQRRGLSQRQLAERMRVPRTYVSKIENDKATPTFTSLERMALAMQTSIACLLASGSSGSAGLLDDAFIRALLPFVARLGPQHRERLLQASQHLAQRAC
ncbi:MAG: helix-turn-helix domain-containing protein [Terriglobales bacterium]